MADEFDQYKVKPADDEFAQYKAQAPAPQPAPAPSFWDRVKGMPQAWQDQMSPVDQALAPRPSDGTLDTAAHNFGGAAASTLLAPIMHPWNTAKGVLGSVWDATPPGMIYNAAHGGLTADKQQQADALKDPARAVETGLGQIAGMGAAAGIAPAVEEAPGGLKDAAAYDPDKALRTALSEGPKSSNVDQLFSDADKLRWGLKGSQSLADVQNRLGGTPAASGIGPRTQGMLSQIYSPYADAIEKLQDQPVGNTTVGELEQRRSALSNQLQDLQTDQSADASQQRRQVQAAKQAVEDQLFPVIEEHGVNARDIMQNYGAGARLSNELDGRSTRGLKTVPSGAGRFIDFSNPLSAIKTVGELGAAGAGLALGHISPLLALAPDAYMGARDIIAGRHWLGENPVDRGFREGFRSPAPNAPNFGQYTPKPLGSVGYPSADTVYSRTPVANASEAGEMNSGRPGVISISPNGQAVFPRLQLGAPEATPRLSASVLPRMLAPAHEFTAPYTPRSAGRLLDLENPQANKPTVRRYGAETGTDKGAK